MKSKSFTFKMLQIFIQSGVISLVISGVFFYIAREFYVTYSLYGDFFNILRRGILGTVGDYAFFLLIFLIIFTVCFFLTIKKYSRIINDISDGISKLASGDFEVEIKANANDPIGEIAQNVCLAGQKLKFAVESGDFSKTSKDRLVINIAHDLRTPLTSITGYLNLVLTSTNISTEKTMHYVEIAYNKSIRMERLIDNLFEFTKYNYGETKINATKINFYLLTKQILEEYYLQFKESNLECREILLDEHIYVNADGDLIVRVLENIISNAIKYGEEGKYVDVELYKEKDKAICKITNYDSPIPEDELTNIFDSFYRTDKSRTSTKYGNGLGLAIAKNIMELHGGEITVSSNFEKTTFQVTLKVE